MQRTLFTRAPLALTILGEVSVLALLCGAGAREAWAQQALPAVTVNAPAKARPAVPVRQVAAAPGPRRVARVRRRAVPVVVAPAPVVPVASAPPTSTLAVPPSYAGGQVARGGQLGLLGNRDVLSTPFNQTSYTAQTVLDQQAQTIGDVLQNDPSVRNVSPPGSGIQAYFVRGFYYDSGDIALNGLYGLTPQYATGANFVERVEVLKGPGALLNGISPAGAVGGSINLVTKKAPDADITQITPFFISRSQFGVATDMSRRAGDNKEWGIRFNGEYRNGNTPFDRQRDEFGNATLGVDYRGQHVRVSADAGYQSDNVNPPIRFLSFLTSAIPPAPRAGTNYEVPWATFQPKDAFGDIRGEVDLTDWATAYAAIGYHDSYVNFIYPSPRVFNSNGAYISTPFGGDARFGTVSGETGLRATVDTGPVHHALSLNFSEYRQLTNNLFRAGTPIVSNIYNPPYVPPQYPPRTLLNQRLEIRATSVGVADTASILNDHVQFTAGVRRQTVDTGTLNKLSGATTSTDTSVYSPAFGLVLKPLDTLAFYANYIEGLQAGQVVGPGFGNSGQIFPAFVSTQAEAGIKYDAGRLTATLSVFQITQPSIVTVAGALLDTQSVDGQQKNQGVEFNVFGEVTPELRVLGGVAFIDGRQTHTAGGRSDGFKAPGVADTNVNIGAELDVPYLVRGLTLTGRAVYTSLEYVNAANTLSIPAWTRVDLGARYTFLSPFNGKPVVLRASVENVANLGYYAATYSGGAVSLGAPRTFLVSATMNF